MQDAWLTPHFSNASWVVVAALTAAICVRGPIRARRSYRQLARDRADGVPGALVRYFRAALTRQLVYIALVVAVVAADGGVSRSDLGLALPSGTHAAYLIKYCVALCILVLITGVLFARRARLGRRIPGQRLFQALIPGDSRERLWGIGVALGAGASEELVFRGLFTVAAGEAFGVRAVWAAVIVSAVFGLCHAYQGLPGIAGTAVAGGLLSYLYLGSRSLLLPIVVHAAIDLRALLVPLSKSPASPRHATPSAPVAHARPAPPILDDRSVDLDPPRLP